MELQQLTQTYQLSLIKGTTIQDFLSANSDLIESYRVVVTGKPSKLPDYLTAETSWVSDSELLVDISDDNSFSYMSKIGFWNQFDHFYFYNYAYLIPKGVENLRLDFEMNKLKDPTAESTQKNMNKLNKLNPDFALIHKPEGLLVISPAEE